MIDWQAAWAVLLYVLAGAAWVAGFMLACFWAVSGFEPDRLIQLAVLFTGLSWLMLKAFDIHAKH